jgi:hypothetical protein
MVNDQYLGDWKVLSTLYDTTQFNLTEHIEREYPGLARDSQAVVKVFRVWQSNAHMQVNGEPGQDQYPV